MEINEHIRRELFRYFPDMEVDIQVDTDERGQPQVTMSFPDKDRIELERYADDESCFVFMLDGNTQYTVPPMRAVDTNPPWKHPMFSEDDRQDIWDTVLDEARDMSAKDMAETMIDDVALEDCIGYIAEDVEALAEMLQRIRNTGDELYITGEFLREHDDGDSYPMMLDFAKKYGLLNDAEDELTDLGNSFLNYWS